MLTLLALISACTQQPSVKPESVDTISKTENAILVDDTGSYEDTVRAYIDKITDLNGKKVYQRSFLGPKNHVFVTPGRYTIQLQCFYRGYFQYLWVEANLNNSQQYKSYCLGDTSDKILAGKKVNMFFAFLDKMESVDSNKLYNQKIIESPPTDLITSDIAKETSRLVVFVKKDEVLGLENLQPHTFTINNKKIAVISPGKYIAYDIPNGEYDVKMEYKDLFTFKGEFKVSLSGGITFLESQSGVSSVKNKIYKSMPEDFYKLYKPQIIRTYFKSVSLPIIKAKNEK